MKDIVGQRLAFVKQGNVLFGIHANRNSRISHGNGYCITNAAQKMFLVRFV